MKPPLTMPNVFDCLDAIGEPQHVYVVGAGANGQYAYDEIPAGAFTIAVNRMIAYPRAWTIWLAFDRNMPRFDYWKHGVPPETKVILGPGLARQHPRCDYYFTSGPRDVPRTTQLVYGGLRGGGTIVGCAMQLAYHLGAEHITLVGVDMVGRDHYDATLAADNAGVWLQLRKLQSLVALLAERYITVDTMTRTCLHVPHYDPHGDAHA